MHLSRSEASAFVYIRFEKYFSTLHFIQQFAANIHSTALTNLNIWRSFVTKFRSERHKYYNNAIAKEAADIEQRFIHSAGESRIVGDLINNIVNEFEQTYAFMPGHIYPDPESSKRSKRSFVEAIFVHYLAEAADPPVDKATIKQIKDNIHKLKENQYKTEY